MNVLYDLSLHYLNERIPSHGGNEYSKAVLTRLIEESGNHKIYGLYDSRYSIEEVTYDLLDYHNIKLVDIKNANVIDIIKNLKINTFFTPSGLNFRNLDFSGLAGFKYIFTIHGIRKIILPYDKYEFIYSANPYQSLLFLYKIIFKSKYKKKYFNLYSQALFPIQNKILITVSGHSKYSFITHFPQICDKIHVFSSPLSDYENRDNFQPPVFLAGYLKKSFYLIVSAGIWEKNSYRAIKAFDIQTSVDPSFNRFLLVVGNTNKLLKQIFKHNSRIKFIQYLDRDTLEYLYCNAFCLIYPSLREGFGYPPLEALKYGTLVLSSGIDPMISNLGKGALYFNPYSIEDIRIKLVESHYNKDYNLNESVTERIQAYKRIFQRQKEDLRKLINLILNHS